MKLNEIEGDAKYVFECVYECVAAFMDIVYTAKVLRFYSFLPSLPFLFCFAMFSVEFVRLSPSPCCFFRLFVVLTAYVLGSWLVFPLNVLRVFAAPIRQIIVSTLVP